MALMGLDIGGAETHVLELSKELSRRGYNVIIASNGGVFETELAEFGVKHYKVRLNKKNPINVVKSLRTLAHIIRCENIHVVHAHARIPGFICGILKMFLKFTFVTSAHWVFNSGFGYRQLSNWGERTIAVSDDIKTYLIDNYKLSPQNIFVTINGIDTQKFSADTDTSGVLTELSLSDSAFRIVYCSRLDADRAAVAFQLLDIASNLDIPNLEIVMIGGGDVFDAANDSAQSVNRSVGRKVVTMTGSRTDVQKIVATAHLFVGVSRAALEAMSCGKPVIVAGNEGYIGLFDESKLQVAVDTNFCCRGCVDSTADLLKQDILRFFNMPQYQRQKLGDFGRRVVIERYSVAKMAQDNIMMYIAALHKKKYSAVISGYYGHKNSGDDALLQAIKQQLVANCPYINITVLSRRPRETRENFGVNAVFRFNPFSIHRALRRSGILISGGGSLIQDGTSNHSLYYYLYLIQFARKLKLKIMLYANSIGPINNKKNYGAVKKTLEMADLITLRDDASLRLLQELGVNCSQIKVTADPAFALLPASEVEVEGILKRLNFPKGKQIMIISLRRWKENCPDFEDIIAKVADFASHRYNVHVVFLPMQFSVDLDISQRTASKMSASCSIIETRLSAAQTIALMKQAKITLGMRLHSLIFSIAAGTPLLGLEYDPKISGFMEYIDQNEFLSVRNLTFELLRDKLAQALELERNDLLQKSARLRTMAMENGVCAAQLIEHIEVPHERVD